MAFKAVYLTEDDIPEELRGLNIYTKRKVGEKEQWELTGFEGVKTDADVKRVQDGATKERNEHNKTKDRFKHWIEKTAEDIAADVEKLDKYDELVLASEGKIDAKKMDEMVETRIKTRLSPVERELKEAQTKLTEAAGKITDFESQNIRRTIRDDIAKHAAKANIRPSAMPDAIDMAERLFEVGEDGKSVTMKDNVGFTPGIDGATWFQEIQPQREHWWPESEGTGSKGSKGGGTIKDNPWHADHWNKTAQSLYFKEHGKEKAEKAAAAVGSSLGAVRPTPKTA